MIFKEAFELMKQGAKVKLPGWNGYWCWDDDKKTIMIHCRPKDSDKGQGDVLDIRETQRVEYTFMHTQRDDLSQASNSDIEKHLHEQDSKYFLKIIENQNKIISMLEESISTKK